MIPTGSILALKTRGKYKKKYLKYAKNPEEVPNEKDFFRIFLCIKRGYRSIIQFDDFATPP